MKGRFVYIEPMLESLTTLYNYFSIFELRFIFGNDVSFIELTNIGGCKWSKHFFFRHISSGEFAGYLRVVVVNNLIEIHGGGKNDSFCEKLALSEAWLLIIDNCFQRYNVNTINTSCMIDNKKGYKLITGTGFKEINRDLKENRINFSLTLDDFKKNSKTRFIKNKE